MMDMIKKEFIAAKAFFAETISANIRHGEKITIQQLQKKNLSESGKAYAFMKMNVYNLINSQVTFML